MKAMVLNGNSLVGQMAVGEGRSGKAALSSSSSRGEGGSLKHVFTVGSILTSFSCI